MQLFALNESGKMIAAPHAVVRQNYCCLECRGVVRLRAGIHRQRHFYHLQLTPSCRLSGKSMEHLQTQLHLQKLIGCQLEVPFFEIGRIADAFWPAEKLVFEVQCSPIRASEVAARNQDYARLGLQVVWLLHTRTFGRERVAAAEMLLRTCPCYLTTVNASGEGEFFDRFDTVRSEGIRVTALENLTIDLRSPRRCAHRTPLTRTRQRLQGCNLYFSGDLVDVALSEPGGDYILRAQQLEQQQVRQHRLPWWRRFLCHPYRILFQHLLEGISR
jgi:competence protein CoiA